MNFIWEVLHILMKVKYCIINEMNRKFEYKRELQEGDELDGPKRVHHPRWAVSLIQQGSS